METEPPLDTTIRSISISPVIVDECATMVSPSTASTVELAMSSLSNTSAILIGSSLSTMLGPPSS